MSLVFVNCQEAHSSALRAFLARTYPPDYVLEVNEALFHWQFRDTPGHHEPGYHLKLALLDKEIVGCLGFIPVEITMSGQIVRGAWTANWMVDTELRRLGVGVLLMRELMRQFDVVLVVGLSREAHDLLGRMRWTDFGCLFRYVCVLDVKAVGCLLETGRFSRFEAGRCQQLPRHTEITVQSVSRFCDEATLLWDAVWGRVGAGTRRSAEFLNWRYAFHPVFVYRLFEARRAGRLIGFSVYRVEEVRELPARVGRIVELVSERDQEGHLLEAMQDDARAQGVALLDFFCASQRFSGVLAQCGFLPGEEEPAVRIPILYQPLDRRRTGIPFMAYLGKVQGAGSTKDWYVTKGDGDQDRPN